MAAALNASLRRARGSYLLHLDADDLLEPNAIETARAAIRQDPNAPAITFVPVDHPSPRLSSNRPEAFLLSSDSLYPRLYRKSALLEIDGWSSADAFGGRYCEDRWILYRLSRRIAPARITEHRIARIRARMNSLSRGNQIERNAAKSGILELEAAKSGRRIELQQKPGILTGEFRKTRGISRASWRVVIPFHGDATTLGPVLDSWHEVRLLHRGKLDIVVVDDGYPDPLQPAIIRDLGARLVRLDNRGWRGSRKKRRRTIAAQWL